MGSYRREKYKKTRETEGSMRVILVVGKERKTLNERRVICNNNNNNNIAWEKLVIITEDIIAMRSHLLTKLTSNYVKQKLYKSKEINRNRIVKIFTTSFSFQI